MVGRHRKGKKQDRGKGPVNNSEMQPRFRIVLYDADGVHVKDTELVYTQLQLNERKPKLDAGKVKYDVQVLS